MERTTILLVTAVVWGSVAARSSSAPLPMAGNATALCAAPTGTCQVIKKFAVVSPATFDVGDRDLEVTATGGIIGDGSIDIVITGKTVTLDKGSVVSNPAGSITIDTSAASTPGACTINGKLTATSLAGSASDGGTVSFDCVGIALGTTSSIESKGDVTSGGSSGGTIELLAETGSLTALMGAKLNAHGNFGGQINLTSGGNCNPLDASMLADGTIRGDVGTGGQVTIACAGNIGLPKKAKIVAGSDKAGAAGSVTIEADGQCAGDTSPCQSNDSCIGLGTCDNIAGGTCHVTTSQTCGDTIDCPDEACVNLVGQCSSDSSTCHADSDCPAVCDKTAGTCSITSAACTADGECPTGETCNGICSSDSSECSSDSECPQTFTCDNVEGNCSVTTSQVCSSDGDCPTEACDGAAGTCSGVPIACQVDSDCDTCQLMGACSDGSQCRNQSGPSSCSSGPCLLPGHCSSTTSQSCTADSDCPKTPTPETCFAQVQIAKGAVIQNDGGAGDPSILAIDLSALGACNINGKLTSDSKPFGKGMGPGVPPGVISFRCAGLTLGSKAVVESNNVGDAAGSVVVDTSDGVVSGVGDPSQTAAPCDIGGTINVKTSAIVDRNNGSSAGQGGVVDVHCGTTLNVSASINASGTGGDGAGTDSTGGSVSLAADTGAATINGKVYAKGKGSSGAISVHARGITIGHTSTLDASGNLPGDPFADNLNIRLSSALSDATTSGDIDIFGNLAAKGTGVDNQGGGISIEGCNVTTEPKSTVTSDGTTGGTNSLTAHKILSISGKTSAVASGNNHLVYGSGPPPATGTVKPTASVTMTTFSGDDCP